MEKIKISILTIVRNPDRNWFLQCLNSVEEQDYCDIQHVILDGSDEDISLEVERIVRSFPRAEYNVQRSKGLWPAFEEGLSLCSGSVLGVLNSDDFLNGSGVISEIMRYFPKVDFLYAKSRRVNAEGKELYVQSPFKLLNSYIYDHLVFNISHHTLYFKKDILDRYKFIDNECGVQAYDLIFTRKLYHSELERVYLSEVVANFRLHDENYSRSYSSGDTLMLYKKINGTSRGYLAWRIFQYVVNPKYFLYLVKRTLKERLL